MSKKIVAAWLALLVCAPTLAAETFQTRGTIASSYAATQNGCVTNYRFMFAASESTRAGGTGEMRDSLYITEYDFDSCQNRVVANATGSKFLTKQELDIQGNSVRVMTMLEMFDTESGLSVYRQVDLTWYSAGTTTSGTTHTTYEGPSLMVITRSSGSTEPALVSGYIGARLINVLGNIQTSRSGTVTIEKKK